MTYDDALKELNVAAHRALRAAFRDDSVDAASINDLKNIATMTDDLVDFGSLAKAKQVRGEE